MGARVIAHLSSPVACTAPSVNPNADCGLGVAMTRQRRVTGCDERTGLAGAVDSGKAVRGWGEAGALGNLRTVSATLKLIIKQQQQQTPFEDASCRDEKYN